MGQIQFLRLSHLREVVGLAETRRLSPPRLVALAAAGFTDPRERLVQQVKVALVATEGRTRGNLAVAAVVVLGK
jgi:hypothetical protein